MMAEAKLNYRDRVAQELLERIEAGTTPWQKPWVAGTIPSGPFNPTTGKPYRGFNSLWLDMRGYGDPRWMTYRQATELDAQVRKGERSTPIEYWQFFERKPMKDGEGNPVLDGDGHQRYVTFELDRPRVFHASVFNAEQIDGLAPLVVPAPSFDPIARAEATLHAGGVPISHDQANRAFYSPWSDSIHLPPPGAFKDATGYYATALHELGHATGHQSRLDRFFGPQGSEGYAREELRAEIASYMLARDLGISFDPSDHAAYIENWLKALKDDKNEIFRAARDAEGIKTWVMEPEKRPELERAAKARSSTEAKAEEQGMPESPKAHVETPAETKAAERAYLAVPFSEKDEAKAAGAKWDRKAKSWYAPEGVDGDKLAKWAISPENTPDRRSEVSPAAEFGDFLKAHGLVVTGSPAMDGQWHRVPVEGDKKGQLSGSYRGFLDGRPSGQATNYKAGKSAIKWVATGVTLSDEQRAQIQAEAAEVRKQREIARVQAAQAAAKKAYGVWSNLPADATPQNCAYLAEKGVQGHGVKVDADGHLVIPARDAGGRLWTLQILRDAGKRFITDGQKMGSMHVIEPTGTGTLDAITPAMGGTIVVAEGYATGATIFEATGRPVVVAFDSGNLKAVAQAVRAVHPEREILVAGDNDHANVNGNVGARKAEEAAQAVGGIWTVPGFDDTEKAQRLTDYNDLGRARGNTAVRREIETALNRGRDLEPARGIA